MIAVSGMPQTLPIDIFVEAMKRTLLRRPSTAVAFAIAVSACSGGNVRPSPVGPAAENRAPRILELTVSPQSGVASLTPFSFSADVTDPDGDPLTLQWTFTDQSRHVIAAETATAVRRIFPEDVKAGCVTLVATDSHGHTASKSAGPFAVGTMTGYWEASSPQIPGVPALWLIDLRQIATGDVSGTALDSNDVPVARTDPASPGRIDADGRLTGLRIVYGNGSALRFEGQMQPDARRVTGTVTGFTGRNGQFQDGLQFQMASGEPVSLRCDSTP